MDKAPARDPYGAGTRGHGHPASLAVHNLRDPGPRNSRGRAPGGLPHTLRPPGLPKQPLACHGIRPSRLQTSPASAGLLRGDRGADGPVAGPAGRLPAVQHGLQDLSALGAFRGGRRAPRLAARPDPCQGRQEHRTEGGNHRPAVRPCGGDRHRTSRAFGMAKKPAAANATSRSSPSACSSS